MKRPIWFIKKKPNGESVFDAFPYFEAFGLGGATSFWAQTRSEAMRFRHLGGARMALSKLRQHDKNIVIVRVMVTDRQSDSSGGVK